MQLKPLHTVLQGLCDGHSDRSRKGIGRSIAFRRPMPRSSIFVSNHIVLPPVLFCVPHNCQKHCLFLRTYASDSEDEIVCSVVTSDYVTWHQSCLQYKLLASEHLPDHRPSPISADLLMFFLILIAKREVSCRARCRVTYSIVGIWSQVLRDLCDSCTPSPASFWSQVRL